MPCPSTSMAIDVRWGRGPMKVLSERWVWDTYFCSLLVPSSQFYACFQVFHFYPTVNFCWAYLILGFLGGSNSKESAWNVGNPGSIPGSERSPEEGNGNPFQYSCLENSMDRGALAYSSWGCKESDTTEQLTLSYLILWLCRSDKSQLMRSNSSQIVTYCLMIKVFIFRVPGSLPRAAVWMCNSPLLKAWFCSRTLCAQSLGCVRLFVTPWTTVHQTPLYMGFGDFPGKNIGMDCYVLLQGIFLTQWTIQRLLRLLHWQVNSLPLSYLLLLLLLLSHVSRVWLCATP